MSNRFLRLPEVLNRVGLRRSTLYDLIAAGNFPPQVRLGLRSVGWLESSIDSWIKERVEKSQPQTSKQKKKRVS